MHYPVGGNLLNQRYLGYYESLLDPDTELPLPSWKGIEWLLEDYGLTRREEKSWDMVYQRVRDSSWSQEALVAVKSSGHYCDCSRRFLWTPDALIDSVEGPNMIKGAKALVDSVFFLHLATFIHICMKNILHN
jgi:hypothetical protein